MGFTYGKYCGALSGKIVQVTGSRASFLFHSDYSVQRRGFRLHFSTVSLGKCNIKELLISLTIKACGVSCRVHLEDSASVMK